jgi:hypothetical protein
LSALAERFVNFRMARHSGTIFMGNSS